MIEISVRQIVLAARLQGVVLPSDFRLEEFPMPKLGPGAMLLKSLDPYMRGRMVDRKSYVEPVALESLLGCRRLGSYPRDREVGNSDK